MIPKLAAVLTVAMVLLAAVPEAQALRFKPLKTENGRMVLVVHDCGNPKFDDEVCPPPPASDGFQTGDSKELRNELAARPYDEVWLISGGGVLDEGIKVGNVLREFQATVRVPKGFRCVSSCTVAFLGGFFRIVDKGASYEVHAASAFLGDFTAGSGLKMLTLLRSDAEAAYANFTLRQLPFARERAAELLTYFQKALVAPGTPIQHDTLTRWLDTAPASTYPDSPRAAADAARFRREDVTAAQETLMRIERDSMEQAIRELRALVPDLGPRAGSALAMLEAMYSSRITFTAPLSQQTLIEMGYVTVFVPRPKD